MAALGLNRVRKSLDDCFLESVYKPRAATEGRPYSTFDVFTPTWSVEAASCRKPVELTTPQIIHLSFSQFRISLRQMNFENLGLTKQRRAVLRVIRESDEHLTAIEVYERAKQLLPGMAFATVYNSLRYLKNERLIAKSGSARTVPDMTAL